jgi:predicted PurR-regulated permease PerM
MQVRQATVLDRPRADAETDRHAQARRSVPRSLLVASELSWRFLVVVAAVAVLAYALWYVRLIALPAFVALLLATILVPPARALRRRGVPRTLSTVIVFACALLLFATFGSLVVPPVVAEMRTLFDTVTSGARELGRLVAAGPFGLSDDQVQSAINAAIERLRASSGAIASGVLSGAMIVGQIIAGTLLTLVLLFFFVKDGPGLWSWIVGLFPEGSRERADRAGEMGWSVLGAYVRGQALVATVDAVFIGIGLSLVGMPLVLPLAVLTFVAAFVPFVGAIVAGTAAVLIALVTKGLVTALIVLGIVLAVQQLEGNVLYPLIMGRTVELHPVATLLAVGAGGVLAGIIGALVSVPLTAVLAAGIPILRGREPPPELDPDEGG